MTVRIYQIGTTDQPPRSGLEAAAAKVSAVAISVLVLAIGLALLVPLILIGALVFGVALIGLGVRGVLARAKAPNGALDGRRGVRVITPDNQPPVPPSA
ncbi:MAG: hypothetical protein KF745_09450 [Phycisphaeraceae bacterium]|nr:hypothetical protein [Phycisphaeraceae bacterium]